jgi:hypothetical protein
MYCTSLQNWERSLKACACGNGEWLYLGNYAHDKENSNAATGSQTLVIQSVAAYSDDSYQTDEVSIVLIVVW